MQPGETLVSFTDGVTDTVGANAERFGLGRLRAILDEVKDEEPTVIRQRLAATLEGFQVGEQADDTAAVFMRFTGSEPTEPPLPGQAKMWCPRAMIRV